MREGRNGSSPANGQKQETSGGFVAVSGLVQFESGRQIRVECGVAAVQNRRRHVTRLHRCYVASLQILAHLQNVHLIQENHRYNYVILIGIESTLI